MGLKAVATSVGGGGGSALALIGASIWSSGTTYAKNALVQYNGLLYVSLQGSNTNHLPTGGAPWWSQTTLSGLDTLMLNALS